MMSVEELKALKALKAFVNLGARIERAKETGIGLYDAGIFASTADENDVDVNDADETTEVETEDESESE
jgi:hypothetical protein